MRRGIRRACKWLDEGRALLKGAQKSFDEALEHEAEKGAIGMPHKEIEDDDSRFKEEEGEKKKRPF